VGIRSPSYFHNRLFETIDVIDYCYDSALRGGDHHSKRVYRLLLDSKKADDCKRGNPCIHSYEQRFHELRYKRTQSIQSNQSMIVVSDLYEDACKGVEDSAVTNGMLRRRSVNGYFSE
jgi:hypothetical protein